jgi:hypothetical protein
LVKKALSAAGHAEPKSVGKTLDALYKHRNALVHDAKPYPRPICTTCERSSAAH